MHLARQARPRSAWMPTPVVGALGVVALAGSAVTVVGSDAVWLSALGDRIRANRAVPNGLPFAAAPSGEWINTTVLGQLILSTVHHWGSAGIVIAQIVAVVWTLLLLANDATRRSARPLATGLVTITVCIGAAASFFIARAQLLSLVPFAVLLVLLRRQYDRPTAGIWWSVPLLAIWSNLHGAVLVGVAVLGCYILVSRLSVTPATAIAVGGASVAATCLNPGLLHAPRYYMGVFSGEATSNASGMWGRLNLTNPFDLLLILAAVALAVAALRRRRPAWEYAAGIGLAVATTSAARHGVWLLLFLTVPAATAFAVSHDDLPDWRHSSRRVSAVVAAIMLGLSAVVLAVRVPTFRASDSDARLIAEATAGVVVLAPEPLAESLAAAGATVWVSNPLDAFTPRDQAAYLAFLAGDTGASSRRALQQADVVIAAAGTAPARLASAEGFTRTARQGQYIVMRRP